MSTPMDRMAITLTEGTCLQVPDLDEWQLLGRVQMRSDMPSELKRSTWLRTTATPDD